MGLSAGAQLGAYQILDKLGQGGMGDVYRARDTRLNRDVALKVLPDLFARDPDRLARFTRDAQVLASLNHPNIAAIYGIEGDALVMELVEGKDLSAVSAWISRRAPPWAWGRRKRSRDCPLTSCGSTRCLTVSDSWRLHQSVRARGRSPLCRTGAQR